TAWTVGRRLCVRSVWLAASTVYTVCPKRGASPAAAACPRLTSEAEAAAYVAVLLLPGVVVSVWLMVAMPVGPATETPAALIVDSVQLAPCTAATPAWGVTRRAAAAH